MTPEREGRPWPLLLWAAPFGYVLARTLPMFPANERGFVAVGSLVAVAVGILSLPRGTWARATALAIHVLLLGVTGVVLALPSGAGTAGGDLVSGILLGLPAVAFAVAGRSGEPLARRLLLYGIGLTWEVALLATRASLAASGDAVTGPSFAVTFSEVNSQQATGVADLVSGVGFTALPLHVLVDPALTALTAVALLGLLLYLVRPRTGAGRPLPFAPPPVRTGGPSRELASTYGFSPAQREVFRLRSEAEPPLTTWPPGLVPVVAASLAATVFLAVAVLVPQAALLGAVTGIAAVAAGLVLVADRIGPLGGFVPRFRPGHGVPSASSRSSPTDRGPPTPSPPGPAPPPSAP